MDPITLSLIASGVKSLGDQKNEQSQRKVQAATTQYSPWTHLQAATPDRTDWGGNAAKGYLAGSEMKNNAESHDAIMNWLKQGYSPYGLSSGPGAALKPYDQATSATGLYSAPDLGGY